MFSARQRISLNRIYDKDFLVTLGRDLNEAGFDKITIKLPYNLVGTEKHEIPLEEFIRRERNYPSVILSAISTARDETLKVLFVNISRLAHFFDDTFPSGHSEPSEVFVQSHDPARVYALAGFFGEYFNKKGKENRSPWKSLTYLAALYTLLAEVFSLTKGSGFFSAQYPAFTFAPIIDMAVSIVAMLVIFSSYRTPTGLYVNPLPKSSIWTLANRALKGQVMDNPLVSFVVTVVASIITALILKLLHLI